MTAKFLSVRLQIIGPTSFLVFVFDVEGITRSCYVNISFLVSVTSRLFENKEDIIEFKFSKKILDLKGFECMAKDNDFYYSNKNTFAMFCPKGLGENIIKQILFPQDQTA